jgi:rhomboid protease GluP
MPYFARTGRGTLIVITLIVLNVAMFLLEVIAGGSTNPFVLHRLGQLETSDFFITGEYWRLLTSLFLHYGPVHLLFNIYALYILGPALERSIGALRFITCYLISGIGSGLGVVLLHILGLTPAEEVVGASGCIMGIVGAWAGFLLRYRHLPLARRRLQNILFIVVIQTVFDLSTPQVSMAAHMCGLITGLVVGLILTPHERPL